MAANTGILTYNSGINNISLNYFSPSVYFSTGDALNSIYCFVSGAKPWPIETNPPAPTQTQKSLKEVYKNMFFAKRVTSNDMSAVIRREDWTTGSVYDYYSDEVDMFQQTGPEGVNVLNFYVRNRYDQVFKCLWNNNGGQSTVEPFFETGTFNKNKVFQSVDGYKWKYMYTISYGQKIKFFDNSWMPVPLLKDYPNPQTVTVGTGSIDVINVTNGGYGYDPVNSSITVTVSGDGFYASANAVVSGNSISDIYVSNTGISYTYANVSISSSSGTGATAIAPVSPISGHGSDPASELGARHIMISSRFEKTDLPSNIDYRQLGILIKPYAYYGSTTVLANSESYNLTTDLYVSSGSGTFSQDELVYQGSVGSETFIGTTLTFDSTNNILKLINISGSLVLNQTISSSNGETRVVLQKVDPELVPYSGHIIYLENRESIVRSNTSSEQYKLVIGY